MLRIKFEKYFFLIQSTIIYYQCNLATAIIGPVVRPTVANEYPFVVSITRLSNETRVRIETLHQCTGVLISKQDVVTAEHCLVNTYRQGFKVMVGSHDLASASPFHPLFIWTYAHWIIYKQREQDNKYHDLAIIKLTANVPNNIEYAFVGNIENRYLYGLDLKTAGWGRIDNNVLPRILQTAPVKVLTKSDCENRIYLYGSISINVDEINICTIGNPYAVLNTGDSGGPLLFFGVLVAINVGICPDIDGNIYPGHINYHLSIRHYQELFEELKTTFYMNY